MGRDHGCRKMQDARRWTGFCCRAGRCDRRGRRGEEGNDQRLMAADEQRGFFLCDGPLGWASKQRESVRRDGTPEAAGGRGTVELFRKY